MTHSTLKGNCWETICGLATMAVLLILMTTRAGAQFCYDGEELRVEAPDSANQNYVGEFGWDTAVSGSMAVVSARFGLNGLGEASVYRMGGAGNWNLETTLRSPIQTVGLFGVSVAASGDFVVVGASQEGTGGAAYVFHFDGMDWDSGTPLIPTILLGGGDEFGHSVAISESGDTVVVGAHFDNDDITAAFHAGSAYVFSFDGVNWVEEAKLTAPTPLPGESLANDKFGESVSISGNTILIGSPNDDTSGPDNAGRRLSSPSMGPTGMKPPN